MDEVGCEPYNIIWRLESVIASKGKKMAKADERLLQNSG